MLFFAICVKYYQLSRFHENQSYFYLCNMNNLENQIFKINSLNEFEEIALKVYDFQVSNNSVYSEYVQLLGKPRPKEMIEIPFLPISFFKTKEIKSKDLSVETIFMSSGTTGMERSQHFIQKTEIYKNSFEKCYGEFIGNPNKQVIFALLPNYLEQGNSSLVYMVDHLIQQTKNDLSGFFLNNISDFIESYQKAILLNKQVVVFGVSYALLDLAEKKVDLSKARVIETGGMKGRRKEMTKEELHLELKRGLGVDYISSEYGMTELLSQAYSDKNGVFTTPNWLKIFIRETNDPFQFIENGKTGGINVIDLANIYSCSFIETQDLGKKIDDYTFQLMGRFDNSDIRGCNLLYREF